MSVVDVVDAVVLFVLPAAELGAASFLLVRWLIDGVAVVELLVVEAGLFLVLTTVAGGVDDFVPLVVVVVDVVAVVALVLHGVAEWELSASLSLSLISSVPEPSPSSSSISWSTLSSSYSSSLVSS